MRTRIRAVVLGAAALGAMVTAAPASADTTAVIAVPACCVSDTVGWGGNVYALAQQPPGPNPEQPTLVRIDPATNTITGSLGLLNGTSSGNTLDTTPLAAAAGSIWVVAYFENVVLRIDPISMTVAATIPVGRSPAGIVSDGKSLWVALQNDPSVAQIDPARNLVVRTVHVGSKDTIDRPYELAYDGTQLLVSMPSSGRVARIDPSSGKVRYDNVGFAAASCANLLPAPGGYWLDDTECSPSYYRWDARANRITTVTTPPSGDWGAVIVNGALYTGEFSCDNTGCVDGRLVKRDVVTGAEIAEQPVGTEAFLPHFAAGSFWVGDFDDATLQRVASF